MAGVTPNDPEGLSQEEIDAAMAAAGGGSADGAAPEAAAPSEETPAEPSAETPAGPVESPQEEIAAAEPAEESLVAEAATQAESSSAPDDEAGEFTGLSQADIDAALSGANQPAPAPKPVPAKLDSAGRPYDEMAAMMEAAIAEERAKAQTAAPTPPSRPQPAAPLPPLPTGALPLDIPAFAGGTSVAPEGIELLNDVELNVKIELGRAEMLIEDVLRLGDGSIVELDKLAGDPVDVLVNDRLVARGEVIVLNENFCVRVSEIVAGVSDEENN